VTKRDITIQVATQIEHLTQKQIKTVFELSLEAIANALSRGDKVELRDFGVFRVKQRKSRMGRNPRTGEAVPIASKRVAYFKPGKVLKEKVGKE